MAQTARPAPGAKEGQKLLETSQKCSQNAILITNATATLETLVPWASERFLARLWWRPGVGPDHGTIWAVLEAPFHRFQVIVGIQSSNILPILTEIGANIQYQSLQRPKTIF